jgi:hypothetical protein
LSYGVHGGSAGRKSEEQKLDLAAAPAKQADKTEHVVTSWVHEYRRRHGRAPIVVDPDAQHEPATAVPKMTIRRKKPTLH